jgi:flagellar basal-body rod modification protein FlgD
MVNEISSSVTDTSGSGSLTSQAIMAKDDFLRLLVAQMQNQDPLSPMESQEFAAELAQFTMVAQLENIDSNLDQSVQLDLMLTQAINNTLSVGTIGKQAKGIGNLVTIDQNEEAHISFNLGEYARNVTISIKDEQGIEVRTLSFDNMSAGDHTLSWNLENELGEELPTANYEFAVTAVAADDSEVQTTCLMIGNVTGVRYQDSQAYLLIDNQEISFGNVMEIGMTETDEE